MMKTFRLFNLGVIVFSYLMLTGFDSSVNDPVKPGVTEMPIAPDASDLEIPPTLFSPSKNQESQSLTPNLDTVVIKQKIPAVVGPLPEKESTEQPQQTAKKPVKPAEAVIQKEIEQTLNLSLPFHTVNNGDILIEQNNVSTNQKINIFASDGSKKTRSIRVDGNVLMTQELEAEKRKSVDGAGIVINLKP